jgi:hypothetical protein
MPPPLTRGPQKITFGEMRQSGARGMLIYCADYHCSHSTAICADLWGDDMRLSDLKPLFVCSIFRKRGVAKLVLLPVAAARPEAGFGAASGSGAGTNATIGGLSRSFTVRGRERAAPMGENAMTPTENLLAAIGPWLSAAKLRMDQERLETLHACLQADGADVQIAMRLREGAIVLDATNKGQRLELYREDVQPRDAQEALKWIFGKPTPSQK